MLSLICTCSFPALLWIATSLGQNTRHALAAPPKAPEDRSTLLERSLTRRCSWTCGRLCAYTRDDRHLVFICGAFPSGMAVFPSARNEKKKGPTGAFLHLRFRPPPLYMRTRVRNPNLGGAKTGSKLVHEPKTSREGSGGKPR